MPLEDGYSKRKMVLDGPLNERLMWVLGPAIEGDSEFHRLTLSFSHLDGLL